MRQNSLPGCVRVALGLVALSALVACGATSNTAVDSSVKLRPQAVGSTYYVNNQSASNCSNSAAGTSSAQPWCDFTPVNIKTFQPGDAILLARGATWN